MNKISGKFILGITVILLITMTVSLYINSNLVKRYYLHEKKEELSEICSRIDEGITNGSEKDEMIDTLEETEEVTIAWLDNTDDLDSLNEKLRADMREKGIGFQKFWLWEEGYEALMQKGRKISLYNQGKLNYSLLVEYREIKSDIFAVAMIIPHLSDAIRIINTVTTFVMICALLVAILLTAILVTRITKPLDHMKQLADDISSRNFHPIEVHTHDELEAVAASMNQMCIEIEAYQNELLDKNRQMSDFLNNVAHDLKTPVALTKAYAGGMKDGLDDGTFLDTIIRQTDRMSDIIEHLLYLSRMEKQELIIVPVALDEILGQLLEEQVILSEKEGISFETDIIPNALIKSCTEPVTLIFDNLLSNALKYSSGKSIWISLKKVREGYMFEIGNEIGTMPDIARLWEPFYVGEVSRNKDLSGTGLGLTLVKNSAEKINASVSCRLENRKIIFSCLYPNALVQTPTADHSGL